MIDIQQLRLASRETTPFDAVNTARRVSQVMTERNSATAELTAKKGGLSKRATIRDIRGYREL